MLATSTNDELYHTEGGLLGFKNIAKIDLKFVSW